MARQPLLVVVTGPTGVGKTDTAIEVARHFDTEIVSADSRQIYSDLKITTAAPSAQQLAAVRHHFVASRPLDYNYSAAVFEQAALDVLEGIFSRRDVAVVCGGSMMYVDALCNGIDEIPTISPETRAKVRGIYDAEGLDKVLRMLGELDPEYLLVVDRNNVNRVLHAVEICLESGTTYTSLRKGRKASRPFRILKCMLTAPREELFRRINARTLKMVEDGMVDEVRAVAHLRHLNSLNTVGVNEMLRYIDGEWPLDTAVARLQKNTRVYAKKQLTWFARDNEIMSFDVTECNAAGRIIAEAERLLSAD